MLVSGAPSSLRPINGIPTLPPQNPFPFSTSSPFLKWRFRDQDGSVGTTERKNREFRILAKTDFAERRDAKGDVIMVDPLEAKRLAAKQMQEIKAREKFKRQRQIEAINGAWAMIGLTTGLIVEGQTGQSVPDQLSGYRSAVVQLLFTLLPWDILSRKLTS